MILRSDLIGAVTSGLCVVHCLATPLLFVAQSCTVSSCCHTTPTWWSTIDLLFIAISAMAVYQSGTNTSNSLLKYALITNWSILTILITNERMDFFILGEIWKYLAAFGLISLHIYNSKFCKCKDESCCIN